MSRLNEVFVRRRSPIKEAPEDMGDLKSLKGAGKYSKIHPDEKERLARSGAGDDPTKAQDPEHDEYYAELGRATFAAGMLAAAKDPEEQGHWRERRRALAKEVDALAKKHGLPTMSQIHAEKN